MLLFAQHLDAWFISILRIVIITVSPRIEQKEVTIGHAKLGIRRRNGVGNPFDNCPNVPKIGQKEDDCDGIENACESSNRVIVAGAQRQQWQVQELGRSSFYAGMYWIQLRPDTEVLNRKAFLQGK